MRWGMRCRSARTRGASCSRTVTAPRQKGAQTPPAREFFFQAEGGIRDCKVTGVQTCALPIYTRRNDLGGLRRVLAGGGKARAAAQPPRAGYSRHKQAEVGQGGGLGAAAGQRMAPIFSWICSAVKGFRI